LKLAESEFLLPSEIPHVAYLVMEARIEAELIWALRLVTKYTQSTSKSLSMSDLSENSSTEKKDKCKATYNSNSSDVYYRV